MKYVCSMLIMGISLNLSAQVRDFTYTNDRAFLDAKDLYGSSFVPSEGKLATAYYPVAIEMGMAQFKFTTTLAEIKESVEFTPAGRNKITEEVHRMSIPSINKQSYGYEIVLMDFKDADIQGYAKIYIDPKTRQATSIVFRPTPADAERVYYLPKPSNDNEKRDGRFFTHEQDLPAANLEEFWGEDVKTLYPHATLKNIDDYLDFNRIYPKDKVSITFEQRMEKIPNSKKEKLVQYICLKKPNSAGEVASEEYQVKKITQIKNGDGTVKSHDIDARDLNQNKFPIQINLTAGQTLSSVQWGDTRYVMRSGKRLAE